LTINFLFKESSEAAILQTPCRAFEWQSTLYKFHGISKAAAASSKNKKFARIFTAGMEL
jgi:hypothetical protein